MMGPVTIERERLLRSSGVHLRVFVRGEDVTQRCRFVDDTPGRQVAELYRRNGQLNCYLDEDRRPSIEIVHDDIEIRIETVTT